MPDNHHPAAPRALVVDLNNFARYPTVAVGYLTAILRRAGMPVRVLSPLAYGVPGVVREPRATAVGLIDQQLRFRTALSPRRGVTRLRRGMAGLGRAWFARRQHRVVAGLGRELDAGADVVLVSAYLMYHDLVRRLAQVCAERGAPVLLGGAYYSQPEVVREWRDIHGIAGTVGGEVEPWLPDLVRAAAAGDDLSVFPGVHAPGAVGAQRCPPLRDLDSLPFPDYSDFPWHKYPNAIVPLITGRGCAWGACSFCSDVTSTAGRTFRSRSPENVLDELEHQSRRHHAGLFVFTDLKLNSSPAMWRAITAGVQDRVPGARWIAAVHVGARGRENALGAAELRAAAAAGAVRLTTGLESGSQRMLDLMRKGTELGETSRFLHDARAAGISVRTTMILGYPGETAADVLASADFLRRHQACIDRVSLNRFQIMTGTAFHRALERNPAAFPGVTELTVNHRAAQLDHRYAPASAPDYRRAVITLVNAVHAINRRPLPHAALDFEGVM